MTVISDWWMVIMSLKDVLRYAVRVPGELCVMMDGMQEMQPLPAGNLDS